MAHHYLSQTWTGTPAGDLTNAIGNANLARLLDNGAGAMDSTAGDAIIDYAEAEVDSILGPGFVVPVGTTSTVPLGVKLSAVDIAIFLLYDRAPDFNRTDGKNPQQSRYDRGIERLTKIREGERDMGNETVTAKSASVGGLVVASTSHFICDPNEDTTGPTGGF